ncbi:MAG: EAL domain-containing protein [Firmicutes bacterium]|nr:EAL domain-containing protein [Bacillota bacterium]
MKTLNHSLERPIGKYILISAISLVVIIAAIFINYFTINNLALLIFILLVGVDFLVNIGYRLYQAVRTTSSAVEKSLKIVTAQIQKLDTLAASMNPADAPIEELQRLEHHINELTERFSHLTLALKEEPIPEDVEKRIQEKKLLKRGEFNQAVYFYSQSSAAYRSAYFLVKMVNPESDEFKDQLKASLEKHFKTAVFGDFSSDTMGVYIPKVNSLSLLKAKIRNFYVGFVPVRLDKNRKGMLVAQIKIGIVVFPYTTRRDFERDALFALSKAKDIYLYLPKIRQKNLIRYETPESLSRLALLSAEPLIAEAKNLNNFQLFNAFLNRELLNISSQFGFANAGYLLLNPSMSEYSVRFEKSRGHEHATFLKLKKIVLEDLKPIFSAADETGSLYGSEIDSFPAELGKVLTNLEINSFYFQVLRDRDNDLGLLYFCSSEPRQPLTVNEQTTLALVGALMADVANAIIRRESDNRTRDILEHLLKTEERYVYLIEKKTYALRYVSENLAHYLGNQKTIGERCYKVLFGRDTPCEQCPLMAGSKEISLPLLSPLPLVRSLLNYSGRPDEAAIALTHPKMATSEIDGRYVDRELSVKNKLRLELDLRNAANEERTGYLFSIALTDPANAPQLNEICRTIGQAGFSENVYRLNATTLAIIFPDAARSSAFNMLEDIYKRIRAVFPLLETGPHYSMTLAQYPNDIRNLLETEQILTLGHKNSLKAGDDMVFIIGNKQTRKADREAYILDLIKAAPVKKTLENFIQPMINLDTNRAIGGEILLRLYDANRGYIPPGEFVPLVSRNKMMFDLEKAMMVAIGELWQAHGSDLLRPSGVERIGINISRDSLSNPEFAEEIKKIISRYRLPKNFIQLEISERLFLEDDADIKQLTKALEGTGVVFALDNFTNRSIDLEVIASLPFTCLKVDRDMVRSIENDSEAFINFGHLLNKANELKLTIIVQGIETESQAKIVRESGVRLGQGFGLAKPMTFSDFIKYLDYEQ